MRTRPAWPVWSGVEVEPARRVPGWSPLGRLGLGRALRGRRARVFLLRWATVLLLIVVYEAVARLFFAGSLFLPPASEILTRGVGVFVEEGVPDALRTTAVEYGIAFGVATLIGLGLGSALGAVPRARTVGRDLLQVLMALPQIAIYPIVILFFGIGPGAKIVFGVTHGVFPILLSTMSGVGEVEETLPRAIRAMGGGWMAVTWRAVLPSALPSVLTGLRVGAKTCLLGVLLAELLSSVNGTGALVMMYSANGRVPQLYALTLGICVGGFVVNTLMTLVERRLTRWRG
jgi:ABC-type nitrate/sulfonate/bicarbonate transport system permease component